MSMQITEPATMLTDYALGTASAYFAVRLNAVLGPNNRSTARLWLAGFVATAIAGAAGGTFHGFALILDPSTLRALWNVTVFSIGACSSFMVAGVLASSIHKKHQSRPWIIRGFIVTVVGAVIQQTGFRQGSHFNHNDMFHVIQIAALYLFFRGAKLLEDYRPHNGTGS